MGVRKVKETANYNKCSNWKAPIILLFGISGHVSDVLLPDVTIYKPGYKHKELRFSQP